jgi:hypothetical protein
MDEQTSYSPPAGAGGGSSNATPPGHQKVDTPNYEVTFHPGFASKCVVTGADNASATLYAQDKTKPHPCGPEGHPKKHVIKLKGKGASTRDITVTIDDPTHSLHRISLQLYEEGRDPLQKTSYATAETFTVENEAKTCPPYCEEEEPD